MSGMDWIVFEHSVLVHLPIGAALLLPAAVVAAQRSGRGIKPWWVTCRYVAWAGVLGGLSAVLSGIRAAQTAKLLQAGEFLSRGAFQHPTIFQLHQWIAGASLVLGGLMLRALHRRREDHQGIGILGLFLGLLWTCATLAAGYFGTQLGHPAAPAPTTQAPASRPVAQPVPEDAEAQAPLKALDYLSLVSIHPEPVKSIPHGNRWIRVWVSPGAEAAYREGKALPAGSLVVMSSTEDRWGRPGYDHGPIYALAIQPGGKASLTFYWPRVPEARRNETNGLERVYWRGEDENLKGCLACHADGIAPIKDRSRWGIPKPKAKAAESE